MCATFVWSDMQGQPQQPELRVNVAGRPLVRRCLALERGADAVATGTASKSGS